MKDGLSRGYKLLKKEKPMRWTVLIGSLLIMLSLFVGLAFNYTILGQPYNPSSSKPPFGREALQPVATILTIVFLAAGLVMVYLGLKEMETR